MNLLTVFLGAGALAGVGLEGHDHLVHKALVVFTTEYSIGHVHFGRSQTLVVQEFDLHQFAPLAALPVLTLIAARTVTKPPLEPGTAPRIISS